ncbi:MAG: EamA family transporter [Desulfamplus sp.]|nr:EamA family transporter [Desulfamplus sp.]MBF0389455.1 EamA family transporter [Desulfamplus sp.]
MTLNAFFFILISALFHVMWNSSLKMCKDKPIAVFLMMSVSVIGFAIVTLFLYPIKLLFAPSAITTALVAGFFFFLYQYFVARAYEKGDLTLVYPLTSTAPVYIVIWSYLLIGEHISFTGGAGIVLIIYGAVTIQTGNLINLPNITDGATDKITDKITEISQTKRYFSLPKRLKLSDSGVIFALAASFFYSFGAVADKMGVMTGNVMIYTFHLSLYMTIFHLLRIIGQFQSGKIISEIRSNPVAIILGGVVMMLSLITFRIGLEDAFASYASALRQVSTLFGILIGLTIFKEKITLKRVISSLIIVAGAVLIKLG